MDSKLRLSTRGLLFIARFEGYRRFPYNDPWNATIGYGHLLHLGKVTARDRLRYPFGLTEPQARKLLAKDARRAEAAVHSGVYTAINQAQYDALVSFVFNCGAGAFNHSKLLIEVNHAHWRQAAQDFMFWDHGNGGVIVPGLMRRREAESKLFLHGIYDGG